MEGKSRKYGILRPWLIGNVFSENQVSGIETMIITFSSILGGAWMDLEMIGGVFPKIAHALPFAHAIEAVRDTLAGRYSEILPHLV